MRKNNESKCVKVKKRIIDIETTGKMTLLLGSLIFAIFTRFSNIRCLRDERSERTIRFFINV